MPRIRLSSAISAAEDTLPDAGWRLPVAPAAGLRHPQPDSGRRYPTPSGGWRYPAPDAGWRLPVATAPARHVAVR